MPLEPGTRLGAYEIVARAGAGGMGEVYKARDTRLDRTVAIKVLPEELSRNEELRQRFEREARAVSALNHPNVCTLHDIGREGDVDFLVMEFLEGETLAEHLKSGALPLAEAITIGRQIADALDKAHRHNVVHRDLKPANIMLTKTGAKLLDFGLAKRAAETEGAGGDLSALPTAAKELTAKGAILGTFQYMAPEQLEGEPVSRQTDIFALGLVLFEMVTGKKAFEGKSQASLISAIMSAEPPALWTLQPVSPKALDAIVQTCLAKAPEDRWFSAGDVARQLGFVRDVDDASGSPGRTQPVALAVAALLGAVVGALALWSLSATPRPEASALRLSIPVPASLTLRGNIEISPDGQDVVFVAFEDRVARLYRRSLNAWESVPIPGAEGSYSLAISPDGRWVAFAAGGAYKKVQLSGGAPTTLADVNPGGGADWGRRGSIAMGLDNGIAVVSENGGEPRRLTDPADPARDPKWLPGEAHLLIGSSRGIELLEVETKTRTFLLEGDSSRYAESGHIVFARDSTLWAVPFDVETMKLSGDPVPVLEDVDRRRGYTWYSLDDHGTLAFIAQRSVGARSLVWVDGVGQAMSVEVVAPDDYYAPRISPDGTRVAVSVGAREAANVVVVDIATGERRPLTFEGSNLEPLWSSDGEDVLYLSRQENGEYGTFRRAERGPVTVEPVLLTEDPRMWDLSPDGVRLAFTPAGAFGADLHLWNESSGSESLGETESFEGAPRFDPTGAYLAYTSNSSGRNEVYVSSLENGEVWMISTGGGRQAVWSRDGRTLYYRNDSEMWSVAIEREPEFEPGTPTLLFDAPYSLSGQHPSNAPPNYDVAADGRFLMFDEAGGGISEIRIVTGVHEELERLAPHR